MAIVLTKEELFEKLKTVSSTATSKSALTTSASDIFDKIATILNNPAIQQIILRIFNRVMPEGSGSQLPQIQTMKPNGETIYNILMNILTLLEKDNPQMTIQELKKKLQEEKDKIMGVLNAGVPQG